MSKLTCWWRGYHLGPFDALKANGELYVAQLRCLDCGELAPNGKFRASTLIQWNYPNALPPLKEIESGRAASQEGTE